MPKTSGATTPVTRAAIIALLVVAGTISALALACIVARTASLGDFRAFYCAGSAARSGFNPYLSQPLHGCELSTMGAAERMHWRHVVVPAPLPGYTIALFMVLSLLPFHTAALTWIMIIIAATVIVVIVLARLTQLPCWAIVCSVVLSVFGASLTLGQLVPISIAGVSVCAYFVARERWWWAAAGAIAASLEPRIGLPLLLSLALWLPAIRIPLAIACGAIAAVTFALPASTNFEYLANVLPAHARSEIGSDEQYSLSVALYSLGMPVQKALSLGMFGYAAAVSAGVVLARLAATRLHHSAFYVVVPPAFAVVGGPFIHLTQIAVAIPLLLLMSAYSSRFQWLTLLALTLIALPWPMAQAKIFPLLAATLTYAMLWSILRPQIWAPIAYASVVLCIAVPLSSAYATEGHRAANAFAVQNTQHINPRELAEVSWARLMSQSYSNDDTLSWLKRAPTWIGLLGMVAALTLVIVRDSSKSVTAFSGDVYGTMT